jgi:multidrug efflux pump subunit AcrA (membrane-fusion protein)
MKQRLVGAAMMAGVVAALLAVQFLRAGWPFQAGLDSSPPHAVTADPSSGQARAMLDATDGMYARLGVQVEPVRREALIRDVRAIATVAPDETRISHVHTRVAGWIEHLDVNSTGQMVRAGQPLARIFSQELLSSQTEYLAARRMAASGIASAVVEGGRARLGVLGMSEREIAEIERSGVPRRLVTVAAPRSGVVVRRSVSAGTAVDPSTELVTIADLSRVWVFAELPEGSIRDVRQGSTALLEFPGASIVSRTARVEFVYPMLSEDTRTLRVRFSVPNADGGLRPGLFGSATFQVATGEILTVPRDAVVDTGVQQHVFVAADDMFDPRIVSVGARLGDRVEILSGLEEGETVVSSGVFLLDSESRLRASGGAGTHQHGGSSAPPVTPPAAKPPVDPHAGHR